MNYYILPYKSSSKSAKLLASSLNCLRIKHVGSRFRPTRNKIVINWGTSNDHDRVPNAILLNRYDAVERAVNKLATFRCLDRYGVPHVQYTTDKDEAQAVIDDGGTVYCRTLVSSSGGRGIVISPRDTLVDAPLYTYKFKTKTEYRIHVFNGSVIDITQKRLSSNAPATRTIGIRNHDNGWIYARNDIQPLPVGADQIAKDAVVALGLDFAAVDLLVDRNGYCVVCEVNSAPGLHGTTLEKYKEAFINYITRL